MRWRPLPSLPRALPARLLRQAAVGTLVAAGLLLVLGLALEARKQFQNLRTAGLDNVQWTALQLEVDVLRLIAAADAVALGEADLGPLRTRFDVLYSRHNILSRGAIYGELAHETEFSAGIGRMQGFLDRHVELIDGPDAGLVAALPALRADAGQLHGEVRQMILWTLDRFSRQADRQRAELAELLQRAALVTAVLLTLLVGMLLLLARLYGRQQADQAALRDARDAALAGQRAKASFVAVMSHEMRTPLNGILASLEILRNDPSAPRQAQFIGLAHSSALQLMEQINDVLDISRIEAGRIEIASAPIALAGFLDETVSALRPLAEARGNRLDMTLAPGLPARVLGDGFRLRQILQNFLSNGIKFTSGGRIVLSVSVLQADAHETPAGSGPACLLEFAVTDTGIGIDPENLDRVFDDFVMLDPTYSRDVGGSGLGLAICRRLAEAMGGRIGVDSQPGDGSRFWVRLPFGIDESPGAAALPEAVVPPGQGAPAGLRLLVVDDNAVNRTVIAQMLADLGHTAQLAATGAEAVQLAGHSRYDAILMDISMPEMDGVTAARHIRSGGVSAEVPIFALTAHAMPDELGRFEAAGLRTSLLKPVRMEALRQALAALASTPSPAQARAAAPPKGSEKTAALPQAAQETPPPPLDADAAAQVQGRPPARQVPAPATQPSPLIDPATRREQMELLGAETLGEITAQFSSDAERMLADLEGAVARGDATALRQRAHEFKGAGATLGFARLAEALLALERAVDAAAAAALPARLDEVRRAWAETREALDLPDQRPGSTAPAAHARNVAL